MTGDDEAPLVYVIAGEASGDALGAGLIRALRAETSGHVRFAGIGGEQMEGEGVRSLFSISEMAVMGIFEILPKVPRLLGRIRQTVSDIQARKPAAVVTIDSKAFTMRVNKRLAQAPGGDHRAKLIHWVPPTVWAWRPGRAKVIAGFLDRLLTLFPFEPPFFEPYGLATTFVGHPAAVRPAGQGRRFRERYGLPQNAPVLGVFPGSRPGEVKRLLSIFSEVANRLAARYQDLHVVIATVPVVDAAVRDGTRDWRMPVTLVTSPKDKPDAFAACTVALAASGTVTLELSLAGVPTIVAYRVNAFSAMLARRLVDPDAVVLTNKLMGRRVVPQFLQEDCTPDLLTVAAERLFDDPRARAEQTEAGAAIRKMLTVDGEDPSQRAARAVLEEIGLRPGSAEGPPTVTATD